MIYPPYSARFYLSLPAPSSLASSCDRECILLCSWGGCPVCKRAVLGTSRCNGGPPRFSSGRVRSLSTGRFHLFESWAFHQRWLCVLSGSVSVLNGLAWFSTRRQKRRFIYYGITFYLAGWRTSWMAYRLLRHELCGSCWCVRLGLMLANAEAFSCHWLSLSCWACGVEDQSGKRFVLPI